MVNTKLKNVITDKLMELCNKHGLSINLGVVDYFDRECDVRIPKEVANERATELTAICEELRKIEGIDSIYDNGARRKLKGDEFRQFEILVKDGYWTHTAADDKAQEENLRKYFDADYAEELKQKKLEKRREYWQEYLLPLPKPDNNKNTELYLTMAYEPYDWIDKGWIEDGKRVFKTTEFRGYNEYYNKKLLSHPIKTVKFQRGYGGPGRGKPEQMRFEVKSITLWDPQSKIDCDPHNPVKGIVPQFFAINLGKRLS